MIDDRMIDGRMMFFPFPVGMILSSMILPAFPGFINFRAGCEHAGLLQYKEPGG